MSATDLIAPHYSRWEYFQGEEYIPIALESLIAIQQVDADVYLRVGERFILYRHKMIPFSSEDRRRLHENRVTHLFVQKREKRQFFQSLENQIHRVINASDVHPMEKSSLLYHSSVNLVEEIFEVDNLSAEVSRSKKLISTYVGFLLQGKEAQNSVVSMSGHDYYTYKHSVEVCTYAITLAMRLGIHDHKTLKSIGLGGLFHDIGKKKIPSAIINKPGKLTEEEWALMQKHVTFGLELAGREVLKDPVASAIVRYHHESLDGSGYPYGLQANDLPIEAKIAAAVDTFSALTGDRAYSKAKNSYDALLVMKNFVGKRFESDVFKQLVLMFRKPE